MNMYVFKSFAVLLVVIAMARPAFASSNDNAAAEQAEREQQQAQQQQQAERQAQQALEAARQAQNQQRPTVPQANPKRPLPTAPSPINSPTVSAGDRPKPQLPRLPKLPVTTPVAAAPVPQKPLTPAPTSPISKNNNGQSPKPINLPLGKPPVAVSPVPSKPLRPMPPQFPSPNNPGKDSGVTPPVTSIQPLPSLPSMGHRPLPKKNPQQAQQTAQQITQQARQAQQQDDQQRIASQRPVRDGRWQHNGDQSQMQPQASNGDDQLRERFQEQWQYEEIQRRRADQFNFWQQRRQQEDLACQAAIEQATFNADAQDEELAIQQAADEAAAEQQAEDYQQQLQQAPATDDASYSPFPAGDLPIDGSSLVGRKFYSPSNPATYLKFNEQGGMLFVSEFKNGKVLTAYSNLNCGVVKTIDGLTRGLDCSVNPYGLEGKRKGSASITLAVYSGQTGELAVSPLFDYDFKRWTETGKPLMFNLWAQK